ncbi:NAD(P)-dependent oxidoreductase [Cryobacterium psychrophilum]|uniref:NAD(P)-dependent oxidoreductase n=1 Tax=Cryobacterium psychrophilum TaxID=41988 RepID=A0A4Y8KVJ6_9MICO|nr:NAD(P)-dependent oxidoreductase [Cryobacterium psychrophilum]TDW29516.1 3-hydroxyisobutyrate dehydrogenase-like beta-hydroxyacid dehydrogenase [Cryobacterium psychrophilum]TFD81650.1 NAD(P)-dependent oxidoreductase [Cryobacterium psychrophilum]
MTSISYVGLGTMGLEMARRLVAAGHFVTIWNRSDNPALAELERDGARRVRSVGEAMKSDVVFSMLAHDAAVREQFSPDVLSHAQSSTIHVNMATVSVALADDMEKQHRGAGVGYLAAPVLGRPPVAAAGQLNIVASGDPDLIARVEPLLAILGKRTWIVGPRPRDANLVKIAVNYNIIHAIQALAESITLIEQGGIAGQQFVDILTDAAFTGSAYTGYGAIIAGKRYSPASFPVALGLKDLGLAEEAAGLHGMSLPVAPVLRDLFERTLAEPDLATLDWSAVAEITRGLAGQTR